MSQKIYQESETLELKSEVNTEELKKEIIAFANTHGGEILIGVNDDGICIGIEDPDQETLRISNMVRETILPDLTMHVHYDTKQEEEKKLIQVDIQEGTDKPYFVKSKGMRPEGVYTRQGTSAAPASLSAIQKMIISSGGPNFEDLRSKEQELTFNEASKVFSSRGVTFNEANKISMHLLKDGLYTNVAYILSDQCPYTTKVAIYNGNKVRDFVDRKEFSGSILRQAEELYSYLNMFNRTSSKIEGLYRTDSDAIDPEAIREAILNSLVHRSYSLSDANLIRIYLNRFEISSLGGIVPEMEPADLEASISICRNPHLAQIFFRLRLIEQYGTGLDFIRETYNNYSVKPSFKLTPNSFTIILPDRLPIPNLPVFQQAASETLTETPERKRKPTDEELSVLKIAERNGFVTRKEVQDSLHVTKNTAVNMLNTMVQLGLLIKEGGGRGVKYLPNTETQSE